MPDICPNFGTTAGDANAASLEPLGSSGGTVLVLSLGAAYRVGTHKTVEATRRPQVFGFVRVLRLQPLSQLPTERVSLHL